MPLCVCAHVCVHVFVATLDNMYVQEGIRGGKPGQEHEMKLGVCMP